MNLKDLLSLGIFPPPLPKDGEREPVFGKYMRLIHPYDFYELLLNVPQHELITIKRVGTTGIPVEANGQIYLSQASINEFRGELYLLSTTIAPVTKNIL